MHLIGYFGEVTDLVSNLLCSGVSAWNFLGVFRRLGCLGAELISDCFLVFLGNTVFIRGWVCYGERELHVDCYC
jgi:hypothetical protein